MTGAPHFHDPLTELIRLQLAAAPGRARGQSRAMPDHTALGLAESFNLFEQCGSTVGFAKLFWPVVEPAREFVPGWHIDCVGEHLDCVSDPASALMPNLIINVPPRTMKSLMTCVFWFCKVWTQQPGSRWMFASFSNQLIERDSDRCRDIVKHPLYQRLWKVRVKDTQDTRLRFTNTHQGFRQCVTTRGTGGMGEGADYLVIDDPQNPKLAGSSTERQNTINWYRSTFSRRGNDERTVRKVLIMQRLNERDLTGYLVAESLGWHHLVLPMRYEPKRYWSAPLAGPEGGAAPPHPHPASAEGAPVASGDETAVPPPQTVEAAQTPPAGLGSTLGLPVPTGNADAESLTALRTWAADAGAHVSGVAQPEAAPGDAPARAPRDAIVLTPLQRLRPKLVDGPGGSNREEEGDLLWPERFPEPAVANAEAELGPDAPGQYAQRPSGASGDIFKEESFRRFEAVWDADTDPASGMPRSYFARVRLHGPHDGQVREFPAAGLSWFQTIDTAMSEDARAAFTACLTFFLTPEFDLGLWHVFRGRANVQYQYPLIKALRSGPVVWHQKTHRIIPAGRWPFRVIAQCVEAKASGAGIIAEGASDGNPFHPLKTDGDKVRRAAPVATMYLNGKVYHPLPGPKWLADAEDELKTFPNGAFKDVADCVAYAGQLAIHDKIIRAVCQSRAMADVPPDDGEAGDREADRRSEVLLRGEKVEVEWPDEAGPFKDLFNGFFGDDTR